MEPRANPKDLFVVLLVRIIVVSSPKVTSRKWAKQQQATVVECHQAGSS
jgi:hypothetical protein